MLPLVVTLPGFELILGLNVQPSISFCCSNSFFWMNCWSSIPLTLFIMVKQTFPQRFQVAFFSRWKRIADFVYFRLESKPPIVWLNKVLREVVVSSLGSVEVPPRLGDHAGVRLYSSFIRDLPNIRLLGFWTDCAWSVGRTSLLASDPSSLVEELVPCRGETTTYARGLLARRSRSCCRRGSNSRFCSAALAALLPSSGLSFLHLNTLSFQGSLLESPSRMNRMRAAWRVKRCGILLCDYDVVVAIGFNFCLMVSLFS